jgi:hypothetical protein
MIDDEDNVDVEAMFGPPNPPGSSVRPTFVEHADKREADERAQRKEACEGCGRIWRHSLSSGHGWRTVRKPDGRWWHTSCWDRRP